MANTSSAAAPGPRHGKVLSADNAFPERHLVIETLRQAAPLLGLTPPVLATLDAMLSCLPLRRTHHIVFASNATLTFRRNGITDRTLRRHVVALQDAGLLHRNDSPNRKRYTRHDPETGMALRFGFDLGPLFARLAELALLATRARRDQDHCAWLRCKLRAVANRALLADPCDPLALATLKALRRKLGSEDLLAMLDHFQPLAIETLGDSPPPAESASDSRNVRHHSESEKEDTERTTCADRLSVRDLVTACPDAAQFAPNPIVTKTDVIAHARMLAPMMGIDASTYDAATARSGPMKTALTIWALLQLSDRIRRMGAYFRSLTSGDRSAGFDPFDLIARLSKRAGLHDQPRIVRGQRLA